MVIRLVLFLFLTSLSSLKAQNTSQNLEQELNILTNKYSLSPSQKTDVRQLILKRVNDLEALHQNVELDELLKAQKRSSIEEGFENSLTLFLQENQQVLDDINKKERKKRAEVIEQMKKVGYSPKEISEYLNKSKIIKRQ